MTLPGHEPDPYAAQAGEIEMTNSEFASLIESAVMASRHVSEGGPIMATIREWYLLQDGRIVLRTAGMGGESFKFVHVVGGGV